MIEAVWQLTHEWEKSWERYKSGNFWTIELDEMEETANVLFRKFNRLSRELSKKRWGILENSRWEIFQIMNAMVDAM